jgi:hypothetical protein
VRARRAPNSSGCRSRTSSSKPRRIGRSCRPARRRCSRYCSRGRGARLDQQTAANVAQADRMADQEYLRPPMQVPVTGATELSPAAGKVIHDQAKANPALASMTGADYARYKSVVASLAATGMPAPMAVQLGIQTYELRNATHPARQDTSGFAEGAEERQDSGRDSGREERPAVGLAGGRSPMGQLPAAAAAGARACMGRAYKCTGTRSSLRWDRALGAARRQYRVPRPQGLHRRSITI